MKQVGPMEPGMQGRTDSRWERFADERIVGQLCAVLVIALMLLINVQVIFGVIRVGQVVDFGRNVPLLGRGITTNTLIDMQWHLMVLISFLPMGLLVLRNGHVRVDVFYNRLSTRTRDGIDVAGHLLLTLPFLLLLLPATWRFTLHAYASGDGSSLGGLRDYYIIRSAVLAGMALLTVMVVIDLWRRLGRLVARAA
jgi:TRAP-type mannitol/chloroaromatic compound transport system permease small subunit